MVQSDNEQMLAALLDIAEQAGEKIIEIYAHNDYEVETKADNSPVTTADYAANEIIQKALQALTPDIPIISEEAAEVPYETRKHWQRYWLVDPLDGTKEFINRTGEFTVNIALIDAQVPVMGVINLPCLGVSYFAAKAIGAFKKTEDDARYPIESRDCPEDAKTIVLSRRHNPAKLEQILENMGAVECQHAGSSLKMCLVAEGMADFYPRLGPTSEWDTAAGQCIVEQAGGALLAQNLQPLRYNTKASLLNPNFFAVGDTLYNWQSIIDQLS